LVSALRNLQQPAAAEEAMPPRKVAPRLAASIRKAVLGDAPDQKPVQPAERQVLFRVPDAQPPQEPAAAPVTAPVPKPVESDPVRLVEAIQASISSVQQEPLQPAAPPPSEVVAATPPAPLRPQATAAELDLQTLLASEAHSRPYRELLATVQRDVAGRSSPVVAILGLEEQESTPHVAAALGTLMAGIQPKATLLIEAYPAHRLAERYGLSQAIGLAETLAGRTERAKAIAATSHPRLDVIPFGQATAEQAHLLPPALAAELVHLRTMHGAVVIDAGPLSSPWALAASRAADAVYLVVRVGDTSAEYATSCVQRFRAAGGKLTGCIAVGAVAS
jgi:Mrp family chromosome partitioning ATPase